MATGDKGSSGNDDIPRLLEGKKTKNEKIKFLAGEVAILADRVDMLEDRADTRQQLAGAERQAVDAVDARIMALERKQASQQAWGDNFGRVMAMVESKVRIVQDAVGAGVPAKTDIEVLRAHCSRLHRENCDLANVLTRVQQEVAQLVESVRKDAPPAAGFDVERVKRLEDRQGILLDEVAKLKNRHDGQTGYSATLNQRITALEDAGKAAAPALDPRLAKYLEADGKYLLVEPVDSAAGREWKAAVFRETENDDGPDEYGSAYAASPGEAVAALVAKLAKHKEL